MQRRLSALLPVLVLAACSGDGAVVPDAGSSLLCETDDACDDGVFCNGSERCASDPEDPDLRRCVSGSLPCDGACDEGAGECVGSCADPDADGDGRDAIACGGDDCDDRDANRAPGTVEVCDAIGHDEDCDGTTLGRDADGDGFAGIECCNDGPDGLVCGGDCDDTRSGVHPEAADSCGAGDEDCDGTVDEDQPPLTLYADRDGDGFGCLAGTDGCLSRADCTVSAGWSAQSGDCDDEPVGGPAIHPGAAEACDGIDNDCSGAADDPAPPAVCACRDGEERECGPPAEVGICRRSTQTCVGGSWPSGCPGAIFPDVAGESCDAARFDEDCDGEQNEGCECDGVQTAPCAELGVCRSEGTRTCDGAGHWGACTVQPITERCDATRLDDDCDGMANESCACTECGWSGELTCTTDCASPVCQGFAIDIDRSPADDFIHECGSRWLTDDWQVRETDHAIPVGGCLALTELGAITVPRGRYEYRVSGIVRHATVVAQVYERISILSSRLLVERSGTGTGAGSYSATLPFTVSGCATLKFQLRAPDGADIVSISSVRLVRVGEP